MVLSKFSFHKSRKDIGVPQLLRRLTAVSVHILGKTITPVTVAKDLGIYIDQSLTYNDHITKIVSN